MVAASGTAIVNDNERRNAEWVRSTVGIVSVVLSRS